MPSRHPLFALAIASTLVLAGCSAPEHEPTADDAEMVGTATMAPGTTAYLPLILENVTWDPSNVSVEVIDDAGLGVELLGELHAGPGDTLANWLSVNASDGATEGTHAIVVVLTGDDEQRVLGFTIEVDPVEGTLDEDKLTMAHLTGLTDDGAVAFTTFADVAEAPLPEADGYQAPQQFQPIPLQLSPQAQLPGDLRNAVLNSDVGHTLTVDIPEAFGPETTESEQPREESIERVEERDRTLEAPRQAAQAQGLIDEDTQVGDPIDSPGLQLPYVVEHLNETTVRIAIDVEVGENHTLFPAWPDGSEVVNVTDSTVQLRTTPTVAVGESFTWNEAWPGATAIERMDDQTIVLRHSPEVGTTFTQRAPQGQPAEVEVVELREDAIVVAQDNPHPMAGHTLTFVVTILEQQEMPQQSAPGQAPSP